MFCLIINYKVHFSCELHPSLTYISFNRNIDALSEGIVPRNIPLDI